MINYCRSMQIIKHNQALQRTAKSVTVFANAKNRAPFGRL